MKNEPSVPDNEVQNVVKDIGIPSCPAVLTKLVRAMRDDDPDFRKISALISSDVGLAAAMLKTVNSAFYGLRTKASSVSQALALLGMRNVERLVTGLLLREAFSGAASRTMEDFWESSSSIALITAWLARKLKIVNHEDAYTFSLFRDCGMAALIANFKDYRPALYAAAADLELMLATEENQYGMNHAALGYRMAKNWSLPETTCDAVLYHHDYDRLINGDIDIPESSVQLIVLALASEWIFTMQSDAKACQGWNKAGDFTLDKLAISQPQLEELLQEADSVVLPT